MKRINGQVVKPTRVLAMTLPRQSDDCGRGELGDARKHSNDCTLESESPEETTIRDQTSVIEYERINMKRMNCK